MSRCRKRRAPAAERGPSDRERIAALEREVAELKRVFEEFRSSFWSERLPRDLPTRRATLWSYA